MQILTPRLKKGKDKNVACLGAASSLPLGVEEPIVERRVACLPTSSNLTLNQTKAIILGDNIAVYPNGLVSS